MASAGAAIAGTARWATSDPGRLDVEMTASAINPNNLRWCSNDDLDDESDGAIIVGEEGCKDFAVIAQMVDPIMGEMIINDVLAHDPLMAAARLALDELSSYEDAEQPVNPAAAKRICQELRDAIAIGSGQRR